MFAILSCYKEAGSTSQNQILNLDNIENVAPHDDLKVDPVDGDDHLTACCEVFMVSGKSIIVLLDFTTMAARLQALTGVITEFGQLL